MAPLQNPKRKGKNCWKSFQNQTNIYCSPLQDKCLKICKKLSPKQETCSTSLPLPNVCLCWKCRRSSTWIQSCLSLLLLVKLTDDLMPSPWIFKCKRCDYESTQSSNLRKHMKTQWKLCCKCHRNSKWIQSSLSLLLTHCWSNARALW